MIEQYQNTASLNERLGIATAIIQEIGPSLQAFTMKAVPGAGAKDASQISLIAIAENLHAFRGSLDRQFWGWCYTIARRSMSNYLRKERPDRTEPFDPDALWEILDSSGESKSLSAADRIDLEFAINLIAGASAKDAAILVRYYLDECDNGEIAKEFGFPTEDAARMQITRSLKKAVSLLAKHK